MQSEYHATDTKRTAELIMDDRQTKPITKLYAGMPQVGKNLAY